MPIPIFGRWLVCLRNDALFSAVSYLSTAGPRFAGKVWPCAWELIHSPSAKVWRGGRCFSLGKAGGLALRSQSMKTGHRVSPRSAWRILASQALGESQGPPSCNHLNIYSWEFSPLCSPTMFCSWNSKLSSVSPSPGLQNLTKLCQSSPLYIAFGKEASGSHAVQMLR